jgi:hypothetical protein
VHLSNMNVGDLTAPQFDERLPDELNLLAPEFIIATGDYTEWARARDDAASWIAVLEYFGRFEAPVFMLCGQHDHEASFSRFVAKDPIGVIDYGGYHGLLLLDHPGNPIEQDYSQLQWIESDLKRNKPKFFSFIACNSDELGLIDVWREAGKLAQLVEDNKLKMFITGGSCDWDYREFAAKLRDIPGVEYVRTHQSSTALRDRATGVSHYRVIEVDGDKVSTVYADDTATERLAHSIPAGKLRVYYDAPNDGSSHRVTATILNALNRGFKDTRVWLRVAKTPGQPAPSVGRGRLVTALDAGSHWACEVRIDLPDKGAVKVCAASLPDEIVPALPIDVALEGNTDWEFTEQRTDFAPAAPWPAGPSCASTARNSSPIATSSNECRSPSNPARASVCPSSSACAGSAPDRTRCRSTFSKTR